MDLVKRHLTLEIDSTYMYTDSRIVLGYIYNEQRRFHVYVGNRIDIIRQSTSPSQWMHVPSEYNPADIATRSISARDIGKSEWLLGPSFLMDLDKTVSDHEQIGKYSMIDPDNDKEVKQSMVTCKTTS